MTTTMAGLDYRTPINKIDYKFYNPLVSALESKEAWMTIVDFIRQATNTNFEISSSYNESPARNLLIALGHMNGTVGHLCDILYKCKLYDALSVLRTEPMSIVRQPNDGLMDNKLSVKIDHKLMLHFDVFGLPLPDFKWYKNGEELNDQKNSKLHYENFAPELQGKYYCKAIHSINGQIKTVQSEAVEVQVFPERCVVLKKPLPKICKREGESISFKVKVSGYPAPKYEWTHNNRILQGINGNEFFKLQCTTEDSGIYRCRIWNSANEVIIKTQLTVLDSGYLFPVTRDVVIEKIALLIGNEKYIHHTMLKTPENDVDSLQPLLEEIGFLVVKKKNLTFQEMKEVISQFCDLLVEGAYVIVYFGGHGFELGEKYMLPIDAPAENSYSFKNCICDCQILGDVLQTKPKLFLLLLDMCLQLPNRTENEKIFEEPKEIFEYEPERNLIQAYATSSRLRSYEIGEADTSYNSLYTKALKEYIGQDLPILKILAKVSYYMERFTRHIQVKQIPLISFNVAQDFCLNMPKKGHRWTQEMYRKMMNT